MDEECGGKSFVRSMDKIARLDGTNDCFEVGFVEREAAPEAAMKLDVRLHLA